MGRSDKKAKRNVDTTSSKKAHIEKKPQDFLGLSPVFSFRKYDSEATWSKPSDGKPSTDTLFASLRSICYTTWGEIFKASGGRSYGTNSHYICVDKLCKEAQQRVESIGVNESELFSLRISGTVRLWGGY